VRAGAKVFRRLLRPLKGQIFVVTRRRAQLLQSLLRKLPTLNRSRFGKLSQQVSATLDILEGRPSEVALALPYWRSGQRPAAGSLDPARDGCGLMWYAPLLPMSRDAVATFVAMVEDICPRHGIDPLITLTSLSSRCLDATIPILFDQTNFSDAEACFNELFSAGKTHGFLPYRVSAHAMNHVVRPGTPYWEMARKLKLAVDPAEIIAPGRYVPR
jgi:4-cresol dehydrogenase (hydroxylating) flavoprotein subunit